MKKILFLAHRIPYPPNKGDKIRSFNELKYLSRHYSVDLLTFADQPADEKYTTDLVPYCHQIKVFPLATRRAKIRGGVALATGRALSSRYFYLAAAQQTFDEWFAAQDYHAVFCFSSSMAEYVFRSDALARKIPGQRPRLVMDFCDVDSDKWRQYADDAPFPMNLLYRREYQALKAYECRIQHNFDATVLVSAGEAELLQQQCPDCSALKVISNGVDHEYFAPESNLKRSAEPADTPTLVFTGAMDYAVNVNGITWFVADVWPQLRRTHPSLQLYIVGSNPTDAVKALAQQDGITVTGFVDDIRDYYRLADVCIAPLHQGRGVQNKVLEAMAMGRPVVTTTRANAGVQGADNQHLLVADAAEDFASAISKLLRDPAIAKILGQAARDYVVQSFDWNTNMTALVDLLNADSPAGQNAHKGPHDN